MPTSYNGNNNGPQIDSAVNITGSNSIPSYASGTAYKKNDLIAVDSAGTGIKTIYRSKNNHTSQGSWSNDQANWDATSEFQETVNLRKDLNTLDSSTEKSSNKEKSNELTNSDTLYPSSATMMKVLNPILQMCNAAININIVKSKPTSGSPMVVGDTVLCPFPQDYAQGLIEIDTGGIPILRLKSVEIDASYEVIQEIREYYPFKKGKNYYIYLDEDDCGLGANALFIPDLNEPPTIKFFDVMS